MTVICSAKLMIVLWISVTISARATLALVSVAGAGASFPHEVYKSWMSDFKSHRSRFVELNMSYEAVGSGTGKSWFKTRTVPLQYAGSDSVLEDQDYVTYPELQMFPTVAGAVVLTYNIPGVGSLILDPDTVVGIYNGTYQQWDAPAITRINPSVQLPAEDIIVIARADKSGTTEIFTRALSSFSSPWKQTYGVFSRGLDERYEPIHWDAAVVKFFGRTNRGVTGLAMSMLYSISYTSIADAKQNYIPFASLTNRAGNVVAPNTATIQSAMDDYIESFSQRFTASIVDGAGAGSYPLATYTYFIIRLRTSSTCEPTLELWRFIDWFISDKSAATNAELLNFVPLSSRVIERLREYILGAMTCDGQSIKELALKQMSDEVRSTQTWRKTLYISLPIVISIGLISGMYFVWQQVKINKAVLRNEWKVSQKRLQFQIDRRRLGSMGSRSSKSRRSSSGKLSHGMSLAGHYGKIALLDDNIPLYVQHINIANTTVLRMRTRKHLLWMRDHIKHINVSKFEGLFEEAGDMYILSHIHNKGRLRDILQDDKYTLDDNFKFSIAYDIACGMSYLAKHGIVHGNLSSQTCYIDEKWNVKVGDWQFWEIASSERDFSVGEIPLPLEDESGLTHINARAKFWTAPEMLESVNNLSKEADVFSFAIMLVEIFNRDDPYSEHSETMDPIDILNEARTSNLRPKTGVDFPNSLEAILIHAWSQNIKERPSFSEIKKHLHRSKPSKKSVLDCMMEAIDGYVVQLEEKVSLRTKELEESIKQTTDLLHQMLPTSVAHKLTNKETVEPEFYESATVFFSDIVGFTALASDSTPLEVVTMLNDLYTTFDDVVNKHDVYKVETIGDAYMVISGVPITNGDLHAYHICSMAIDLAKASSSLSVRHRPGEKLEYRAGIHSGPVCAGVVGITMPRYCIFGDTVNTASRMESSSVSYKIQVSDCTKQILDVVGGFLFDKRGTIDIKGKGLTTTFWLHGKEDEQNMMPKEFVRHIPGL